MRFDLTNRLTNAFNLRWLTSFAVAVVLLIGGNTFAQTLCTAPDDEERYDSSNDLEPDDESADPQWATSCGNASAYQDFASISLGVLVINDNLTTKRSTYCIDDPFNTGCSPRADAVYEISFATINEDAPDVWDDIDLSFICGMRDGLNDFRLGVASNVVGFADKP